MFAVRIPEGEWDKKVLLQFEREMLGLYVSDHPLLGLETILAGAGEDTIANVPDMVAGGVIGFKLYMGETFGRLPTPSTGAMLEASDG